MSECMVEEPPGVDDTTRARILDRIVDRAVRARQVELDAAAALLVAALEALHR